MTHEELIALAKERAKDFGSVNDVGVTLEMLPKIKVLDVAVVCFESDEHDGKIEVYMDKESGKFISATLTPRQTNEST